MQVQLQLSHQ